VVAACGDVVDGASGSGARVVVPTVNLKPAIAATQDLWSEHLVRLFERGQFILGEQLASFEREFAEHHHARFAIGVGTGTSAIELALRDAGVHGEVLTSALTAPFTAVAITAAGCTPRFADIDPESLQIDPDDVAKRIGRRTAAILPVHLYGQPCELDRLKPLGKLVVQDACQAHGARFQGKPLVAWSDYVAYSFYPTKNLGALGDGGAIVTNRAGAARRLRMARDGGRRGDQTAHSIGINSRLDDLQCCYLRAFLTRLEEWNAARAAIARIYDQELADCRGVTLLRRTGESVNHLYVIRAQRREKLREFLRQRAIGTGMHYPLPLHKHPAFRQNIRLPHAEQAAREVVSLPCYPYLHERAVREVATSIREFYDE
jgi:dTDP-4-amino-4,6-dideoxygalactose transaminase